jgi:hypothetical protein
MGPGLSHGFSRGQCTVDEDMLADAQLNHGVAWY